jgi:hypothetical protein
VRFLLDQEESDLEAGAIVVMEATQMRVRRLPVISDRLPDPAD